jgi:hypothetical protein
MKQPMPHLIAELLRSSLKIGIDLADVLSAYFTLNQLRIRGFKCQAGHSLRSCEW